MSHTVDELYLKLDEANGRYIKLLKRLEEVEALLRKLRERQSRAAERAGEKCRRCNGKGFEPTPTPSDVDLLDRGAPDAEACADCGGSGAQPAPPPTRTRGEKVAETVDRIMHAYFVSKYDLLGGGPREPANKEFHNVLTIALSDAAKAERERCRRIVENLKQAEYHRFGSGGAAMLAGHILAAMNDAPAIAGPGATR